MLLSFLITNPPRQKLKSKIAAKKMNLCQSIALSAIVLLGRKSIYHASSFSAGPTAESPRAETARSRLTEALRSPSKKLTIHPELVLPEPSDPTALLLRASEVTKLSQVIRTKAKANAVFVEGTVDALTPMGNEQETARGNFPGPVPIIYSWKNLDDHSYSLATCVEKLSRVDGVEGVLIPFFGGTEIDSVETYLSKAEKFPSLADECAKVREAGIQPIPELILSPRALWAEEDVVRLLDAVKETCGGLDPVSIVFTNGETSTKADKSENELDEDEFSTPNIAIPESVAKRLCFIGSVRTSAGEGRMNRAILQLQNCNFNGGFLRADCVPGYRLNPDLNAVGAFWSAAIGDLKSLKSKNFSFRSKVKLEKDIPMEWYNYQKDVMESGALGMPGGGGGGGLDPNSGDYKGF
ncbi:hypothetical protein ACHAXS_005150 [Conticribra weissflogii]